MKDIRLFYPTHLLYNVIGQPPINGIKELEPSSLCPLCGITTKNAVDWKVNKRFSDLDLFAEKESITFLCPACMFALNHIKELHKAYILTYKKGFIVLQFDDQPDKKSSIGIVKVVSRYFLKDFLLNPPADDPWIMMTQSKINPQHSIIKAKVNYGYSETMWVCNGGNNVAIPKEGLGELIHALEKVKKSDSFYPYLFSDKRPRKDHKEAHIWKEIEPIVSKHKFKHYVPFIYDRIVPPKKYMVEHN